VKLRKSLGITNIPNRAALLIGDRNIRHRQSLLFCDGVQEPRAIWRNRQWQPIQHMLDGYRPTYAQLIARNLQNRLNRRIDCGKTEEGTDQAVHLARVHHEKTISAARDQSTSGPEEDAILGRDEHAASFGHANIAGPRVGRWS
jgi:hypothetical protein